MTDIATITGEADGDQALVNAGGHYVLMTYDATLGKWVSEVLHKHDNLDNGGGLWTFSNAAYANATFLNSAPFMRPMLPWRVFDTAGLKWEFKLVASIEHTVAANTVFVRPSFIGGNKDGGTAWATGNSQPVSGAEISKVGVGFHLKESAWAPVDGSPPTIYDFATIMLQMKATAASGRIGSGLGPLVMARLVSK